MNEPSKSLRGFGAALLATALCMIAGSALAAEEMQTWDGLSKVKGKRLDAVYLLPEADFSGYNSVLLLPVAVAMHRFDGVAPPGDRHVAARITGGRVDDAFNQITCLEFAHELLAATRRSNPDEARITLCQYQTRRAPDGRAPRPSPPDRSASLPELACRPRPGRWTCG